MEKKKILMKSKVAAPNLLRALHSLYQFGHLCDVTVHTQHLGIQEEFLVHKAVLAASSNYFKGLFLHDEMLDTKNCTVTLQDIYTEEFTSFLEFVYTAEVEIEAEKLQRMKEIAERLECKDLLDICEEVKAEGRKGLDLSLHLKGQLRENGGSPWAHVQRQESRKRGDSSQVMAIPVQRKLWDRQKCNELLAGYELVEGQPARLEQGDSAFPDPTSRPAKLPKCNEVSSRKRLGVDIIGLENKNHGPLESKEACVVIRTGLALHGEEQGFSCIPCDKRFKCQKDTKDHIRRMHGKKRDPQACPYCDKLISSKCGLTVHIRTHTGEKPYKCERCPASFAQRSAYNTHIRKIHESGQERKLMPVYWMVVPPAHRQAAPSCDRETRDGPSEAQRQKHTGHEGVPSRKEEPRGSSVAEADGHSHSEQEGWNWEGGEERSEKMREEGDEDEGERNMKGEEEVADKVGCSEVDEGRDNEVCEEELADEVGCSEVDEGRDNEVCSEEEDEEGSDKKDAEEHEWDKGFKIKQVTPRGGSKQCAYVIGCDKCKEQFASRKKYVEHCRDAHQCSPGKAYRCDVCGKAFASLTSWKEHRACVHSEERRFACTLCHAAFKRKRDVRTHYARKHEGRVKRPLCSVCGKILSSRTALVFHMRTHTGEKPYECGVCHARFAQPSQLKIHTRSHTGEKPYICEDCGACFADKGKLTGHKRTHTGERLFRCDVCGKHFATNEYLKCHKRCHLGAKPYTCGVCGKAFGLRASLAQHSHVHAESRPYFCEQCGKTFTQQGALRRHQRIHTGERPYKCRACERTFTDMSTLRRHVSTHDRSAHWRSFLIDLTPRKHHNWSKIETLADAHGGEDAAPEGWSVGKAEPVAHGAGGAGDTGRSLVSL